MLMNQLKSRTLKTVERRLEMNQKRFVTIDTISMSIGQSRGYTYISSMAKYIESSLSPETMISERSPSLS